MIPSRPLATTRLAYWYSFSQAVHHWSQHSWVPGYWCFCSFSWPKPALNWISWVEAVIERQSQLASYPPSQRQVWDFPGRITVQGWNDPQCYFPPQVWPFPLVLSSLCRPLGSVSHVSPCDSWPPWKVRCSTSDSYPVDFTVLPWILCIQLFDFARISSAHAWYRGQPIHLSRSTK